LQPSARKIPDLSDAVAHPAFQSKVRRMFFEGSLRTSSSNTAPHAQGLAEETEAIPEELRGLVGELIAGGTAAKPAMLMAAAMAAYAVVVWDREIAQTG
jgi:hypothetical protein